MGKRLSKEEALILASKFSSRGELAKTNRPLYSRLYRNEWLDEAFPADAVYRNHTKESVLKVAKTFKTLSDFRKADQTAHAALTRYDAMDELRKSVPESYFDRTRKYTKESVTELASHYSTKMEFRNAHPSAYVLANKNGWMRDACPHMEAKPRTAWTPEMVWSEVAKHSTLAEFTKNGKGAIHGARKFGLMAEIRNSYGTKDPWTRETAASAALLYSTRGEFWQLASGAARFSQHQGDDFYERICAHMPAVRPSERTDAEIIAIGATHVSNAAMLRGDPHAYQSAKHRNLLMQITEARITRAMPSLEELPALLMEAASYDFHYRFSMEAPETVSKLKKLGKYEDATAHFTVWERLSEEKVREIAKTVSSRSELERVYGRGPYDEAKRLGILDEILPVVSIVKWTRETILQEVEKHVGSLNTFRMRAEGAFEAATRLGLIDEIKGMLSHFERISYTPEMVTEIAKQYKTRKAFKFAKKGAYKAAKRFEILDLVCDHMPKRHQVHHDGVFLYQYTHPEGFVYVGITSDPASRHYTHRTESHNVMAMFLAEHGEPELHTRYSEYDDTFHAHPMLRTSAERLESRTIRRLSAEGWLVTNKMHNPQFDHKTGKYAWECADMSLAA